MPLHLSVPKSNTMEIVNSTTISPLISKCQIKVCYVGQEPNRNGTVITKEVATEMAKTLPGAPIVGYYNPEKEDFESHSREIIIRDNEFKVIDLTKPYGFVPPDAEIAFQKYDENGVEREYLVATGYLWTEAYPECKRVIEKGNNQSMELTKDSGVWAKDSKYDGSFFIYSEALIEKLCILGEDVEPCFEGAQIKSFSLETDNQEFQEFKTTMYSMINELKQTLEKGGSHSMELENQNTSTELEKTENQDSNDFSKKEEPKEEQMKKEEQNSPVEDKKKKPDEENSCQKKKYNLDEIPEYQELLNKYNDIASQFSALQKEKTTLEQEVNTLREYKLTADRKEKQTMIDSFYMLTDEDKKDVIEHIDTYSLDDIEAKLAITCVRKKVSFNLNEEVQRNEQNNSAPTGMFSLNNTINNNDDVPAWVKAVQDNQ